MSEDLFSHMDKASLEDLLVLLENEKGFLWTAFKYTRKPNEEVQKHAANIRGICFSIMKLCHHEDMKNFSANHGAKRPIHHMPDISLEDLDL